MGGWISHEMTLPIPSFYPVSFWRTEMLPLRWRSNPTVQAGFGVALVSLPLKPNSNHLPLSVPPPKDFHLVRVIEIPNHTCTDVPLTIDLALFACTIFSFLMDQDTKVRIKFQALSIKVTFKVQIQGVWKLSAKPLRQCSCCTVQWYQKILRNAFQVLDFVLTVKPLENSLIFLPLPIMFFLVEKFIRLGFVWIVAFQFVLILFAF